MRQTEQLGTDIHPTRRTEDGSTYLEYDLIWLRDEGSAFEFASSDDLRLNDAFSLAHPRLVHVLFFQERQLWLPLLTQQRNEMVRPRI